MSYPYSSQGQSNAYTSSYAPAIPQYTDTQIYQYYQQYHVYPPQPYHVVPDHHYTQVYNGYEEVPAGNMQGYTSEEPMSGHGAQERSTSQPRTYKCDLPDCTSTANFTRLADLQRHQATVHKAPGPPDYPCSVPECTRVGEKGFTRRDHLVEHLRNFHHIDIPKRRPGERSAPLGLRDFGNSLSRTRTGRVEKKKPKRRKGS